MTTSLQFDPYESWTKIAEAYQAQTSDRRTRYVDIIVREASAIASHIAAGGPAPSLDKREIMSLMHYLLCTGPDDTLPNPEASPESRADHRLVADIRAWLSQPKNNAKPEIGTTPELIDRMIAARDRGDLHFVGYMAHMLVHLIDRDVVELPDLSSDRGAFIFERIAQGWAERRHRYVPQKRPTAPKGSEVVVIHTVRGGKDPDEYFTILPSDMADDLPEEDPWRMSDLIEEKAFVLHLPTEGKVRAWLKRRNCSEIRRFDAVGY